MAYSSTDLFHDESVLTALETSLESHGLRDLKHKYGSGFPFWKRIKHDEISSSDDEYDDEVNTSNHCEPGTLGTSIHDNFKPIFTISMAKLAIRVIVSLLNWATVKFYKHDQYVMLKLHGKKRGISPNWANQFNKMKGIIREPGLLLVQIPPRNTSLSVPGWCRNQHPVLCFVDAVYVCGMASGLVESEAFSNLLGAVRGKTVTRSSRNLISWIEHRQYCWRWSKCEAAGESNPGHRYG